MKVIVLAVGLIMVVIAVAVTALSIVGLVELGTWLVRIVT